MSFKSSVGGFLAGALSALVMVVLWVWKPWYKEAEASESVRELDQAMDELGRDEVEKKRVHQNKVEEVVHQNKALKAVEVEEKFRKVFGLVLVFVFVAGLGHGIPYPRVPWEDLDQDASEFETYVEVSVGEMRRAVTTFELYEGLWVFAKRTQGNLDEAIDLAEMYRQHLVETEGRERAWRFGAMVGFGLAAGAGFGLWIGR